MVRIAMVAVIMLAALGIQASAQESQKRAIIGQGTKPCGVMAREIRAGVSQELSHQWVAGFVSGANMEGTGPDFLLDQDFDGLAAWVDNYCSANPLSRLSTAAKLLVQELRARQRRR